MNKAKLIAFHKNILRLSAPKRTHIQKIPEPVHMFSFVLYDVYIVNILI